MSRIAVILATLFTFANAKAAESAREIIVKSVSADHNNIALASRYTFRERTVEKDLELGGHVRSTKITTDDFLFLGGKPYEHLVEKEDKPLPQDQEKKEQAKLNKATAEAARLNDSERAKRLANFEHEREKNREILQVVPDAFDFKLLGDGQLGGRMCWMIFADPRPGYHGKDAGYLRNLKGKIWIDKTDYQWVRLEMQALNDISFGFFIAKLSKGSSFLYELTRVNDEVWLPKIVTVKVSARALVKHFNMEQEITYSDHRKYQSSSRIVDATEVQP